MSTTPLGPRGFFSGHDNGEERRDSYFRHLRGWARSDQDRIILYPVRETRLVDRVVLSSNLSHFHFGQLW